MASISAILISPDGYETLRRLVNHLHAQTIRREIELVFVFPACVEAEPSDPLLQDFAAVRVVRIPDLESTARARAAGVRQAGAPVVVMTEDHSLPEEEWAEALVRAHQKDWGAVGPAVKNGNPHSLLSWANLVIEYLDWLHPAPGGEAHHLPGHNSAYKRDLLLAFGDDLGDWLEAESVLHWRLRADGHRVALEPAAVTRHYNFSRFLPTLALRYDCGRQFAAMCRVRWSLARRLLYIGGSPLIPFVRVARIVRQMRRPGRPARLLPALAPLCLFLLAIETVGAVAGYAAGPGSSIRRIARIDFHREDYMNRRDRRIFEGLPGAARAEPG
ncbi:MAG: glycosyltransferase [Bryobacterales bacterium]|nr:glycosyltransferase [Bryobacterales bacterium]